MYVVMSEKHIYKIVFINREQVYELYAKSVYQGDILRAAKFSVIYWLFFADSCVTEIVV